MELALANGMCAEISLCTLYESTLGAGDTVQMIKHLSTKHENLSLDLWPLHKQLAITRMPVNPSLASKDRRLLGP